MTYSNNRASFFYSGNNTFTNEHYWSEILEKLKNQDNYFVNKYIKKKEEKRKLGDVTSNKSVEDLTLILDILYNLINLHPEYDNIIEEIYELADTIRIKSEEVGLFNCLIFDFILQIKKEMYNPQYINNFIKYDSNYKISNKALILVYPSYIIFLINYYPKSNSNISEFLLKMGKFMKAYAKNVFNQIEEEVKKESFTHHLQINYLFLFYFLVQQFIIAYKNNKNENESIDIGHLPYCPMCKKKNKNPLIMTKYLSRCNYCDELFLYINSNLIPYLRKNIPKNFIDGLYESITFLTCNILNKFKEKYEKRNTEKSMANYQLYYKIIRDHFAFLNYLKRLVGHIPFLIIKDYDFNNEPDALEESLKSFRQKYLNDKTKYPFKSIYDCIENGDFGKFNIVRKAIKHESQIDY